MQEMTEAENEAMGRWLAGITVGQYRGHGVLYVGPARTMWAFKMFREFIRIGGNIRRSDMIRLGTTRR